MHSRSSKFFVQALALAIMAISSVAISAQDKAKSAAAAPAGDSPSKWDIFLGYSYLAPTGQVKSSVGISAYQAINFGGIVSATRFFNNNVGAEVIVDEHTQSQDLNPLHTHWNNSNDDFGGAMGGVLVRFPSSEMSTFLHALGGTERIGGPAGQPDKFGEGITIGGGLDYAMPFHLFGRKLDLRLVQADFQYFHDNFGVGQIGGHANVKAVRLSSGLVYHIGTMAPPPPVTLACAVSPTTPIFPGDPVTATATAGMLNPKLAATYTWSGTGVTGKDATASVATATLAPGSYTVKVTVAETVKKPTPGTTADCSGSFTVRDYDPPTISCAASPSQLKPGDTSNVTSTGVSPQNRPLTYSYSATSGSVSGSGSSTVYTAGGAGDTTITCNVTDDKGKSASATTMVTVAVPYVKPVKTAEEIRLEKVLALHSVFFPTAQPREKTPTVGLVPSQEATLDTLATDFKSYLTFQPSAHLILTGHADIRGTAEYNKALTDRRVARAKAVLVEKGVSEAAIDTKSDGNSTELDVDQVKALIAANTALSADEQKKIMKQLPIIVLAQNRRVDITLSTTGAESVQLYPFNAADSMTLLDKKAMAPAKTAAPAMKMAPAKKAAPAKKKM